MNDIYFLRVALISALASRIRHTKERNKVLSSFTVNMFSFFKIHEEISFAMITTLEGGKNNNK